MRSSLTQPEQISDRDLPRAHTSSSNHSDSGIVARQPDVSSLSTHNNDANYFSDQRRDTGTSQHAGWVMPYATTQPPTPPPQPQQQQQPQINQFSSFSPTSNPAPRQPSRAGGFPDVQSTQPYADAMGSGSSQFPSSSQFTPQPQATPFPETMSTKPWPDFATMELGNVSEMPPFSLDGLDPLQGFDIPFWIGHDNTAAWMNHG